MFRSRLLGALGASPMRILASVGMKVYLVSMRYDSAVEKLGVAVHRLVELGDIKDRLHQAYLSFEPLQPSDLPEHLRDEFRELKNALTWLPVDEAGHQEGTLASTLDRMSDGEADRLARKIYELLQRGKAFLPQERVRVTNGRRSPGPKRKPARLGSRQRTYILKGLRESLNRYRNELMDDEERMLLLDRIQRIRK